MRRVAFLTMESLEGFVADDELACEPLARLGWEVGWVPWRRRVDWNEWDAVVIRTPWDYQDDPEVFLGVLAAIDRSSARLENDLSLVRWNLRKTYLAELGSRGVAIVPTLWGDALDGGHPDELFERLASDEIIVKPVIGANAHDTFRLTRAAGLETVEALRATFASKAYMAQPFLPSIVAEGEFSLFFFDGEYSHAILKTPQPGDFRVQEEHGGLIQAVSAERELLACARRAIGDVEPVPLYARVDLVRVDSGAFLLMELELIEPALYFRMDTGAAERFARAFDARLRG
jgi:hypothetical protein